MDEIEVARRFEEAQVAYRTKIRTAARNSSYVSRDHDVEDMEQELLVCLWETCRLYDPDRGSSFNGFFWMRARQRISHFKGRDRVQKRGSDIMMVELDPEVLVDELGREPSAEDEALAPEGVREWFEGAPSAERRRIARRLRAAG